MVFPRVAPNVRINQKDVDAYRRKIWNIAKRIEKDYKGLPADLAKAGQLFARGIAPVYSGTLVKAILYKTIKGNKAELYIDESILNTNPNSNRYTNEEGDTKHFNYAAYMHETNGVMGRGITITSGDPRFMFTTRDYLLGRLREKIKINLGG